MSNRTEYDNPFRNKPNLCFRNVYYHEMLDHNVHNRNATNVEIEISSKKENEKEILQHAIVSQEH